MNVAALIGIGNSDTSIMVLPIGNSRVINSPNSVNPCGCGIGTQKQGNAELARILMWVLGKCRDLTGSVLLGRRQSPILSVRADHEVKSHSSITHDRYRCGSQPYQPGERRNLDYHNPHVFQLDSIADWSTANHLCYSHNPGSHRVNISAPSRSNPSRITSQIQGRLSQLFADKLILSQARHWREGAETRGFAPHVGDGMVRPLVKARAKLMLAHEGWDSRINSLIRGLVKPRKERIVGGLGIMPSPLTFYGRIITAS